MDQNKKEEMIFKSKLYHNIWVVLVGPPGTGKTTFFNMLKINFNEYSLGYNYGIYEMRVGMYDIKI